jgi:hypothetical protein
VMVQWRVAKISYDSIQLSKIKNKMQASERTVHR